MRPPRTIPVTALFALLVLHAPAWPGVRAARAVETSPLGLTIAFTGDVIGYLEPCG